MSKICGIYKITSPSNKIYIGQSKNINRRKRTYINLNSNSCGQIKLYRSIIKYGWDAHVFEFIHECKEYELNGLEEYYIKFYNTFDTENGMNLTSGGNSPIFSEESKKKMSKSGKGKHFNKIFSIERRRKMSLARKNIIFTEEYRKKLGIACSRRIIKEETRIKLHNRTQSIETRKKISDANASSYEIYSDKNELFYKFHGNIKKELKKLKLPIQRFCNTYLKNVKIKNKPFKGWYIIKL